MGLRDLTLTLCTPGSERILDDAAVDRFDDLVVFFLGAPLDRGGLVAGLLAVDVLPAVDGLPGVRDFPADLVGDWRPVFLLDEAGRDEPELLADRLGA